MARFYMSIFIILSFVAGIVALALTTDGIEMHVAPALSGYQDLPIVFRQEEILVPPQAFAGRTLVTQFNQGSDIAHTTIFRIPDNVSEARVAADLAQPRQTLADATPAWLFRAVAVGSPDRAARRRVVRCGRHRAGTLPGDRPIASKTPRALHRDRGATHVPRARP